MGKLYSPATDTEDGLLKANDKKALGSNVFIRHNDGTMTGYGSDVGAAATGAVSGDTVIVGPGTYTVTGSIAKNGVNWWGPGGVTIQRIDAADGFIFDASGGKSFTVGGSMNFLRTIPTDNATTIVGTGVLKMGADAGTVSFHFGKADLQITAATGDNIVAGAAITVRGGRLHASGDWISNTDPLTGSYSIWWEDGTANFDVRYLSSITDGSLSGQCATSVILPGATGHLRINAQEIYADGEGDAINTSVASGTPTVAVWVTCNTLIGGLSVTGGKTYITAQKVIGPISCLGGKLYLDLLKQGNALVTAAPYILVSGGTVYARVNQFEPGTNVQELVKVSGSGAVVYLHGEDFTANTGQNALRCTAGTLNFLSGIVTSDGGKLDLLQSTTGSLRVSAAAVYSAAKTSGSITKLNTYGAAPP